MTRLLVLCVWLGTVDNRDRPCVIVVIGAPAAPVYKEQFERSGGLWKAAAERGGAEAIVISGGGPAGLTDCERLRSALIERSSSGRHPLWIILIGHGTYDGHDAKFNLNGPDVTDGQLGDWLITVKRPVVVINCASASGPFINRLSGPNRVVVVATKSGFESNFSRFGTMLAETITDTEADLDKDGQVSLLEAYLMASSRVEEYYRAHSQLASEHALLDDNGDRLGTPANWFKGVHAAQRAKDGAALDGIRAHQLHLIPSDRERGMSADVRQRRDELESSIASIRDQKEKLKEDEYYARLERLMVELARLYRDAADGNATAVRGRH